MPMLAELNDPDYEIWEGIDFGHDVGLLPDSWVDSASKKNYGGFATQDCRSQRKVHFLASYNH
jgi:hypothetical protein